MTEKEMQNILAENNFARMNAMLNMLNPRVTVKELPDVAWGKDLGEFQPVPDHPFWISVKDKLPALNETVLVVTEENKFWVADRVAAYWDNKEYGWYEQLDGCDIGNVTHWMPIPPLPR